MKHSRGKQKLAATESRIWQICYLDATTKILQKVKTLSIRQRAYRFKVVRTSLKDGVTIHRTDQFEEILKEQGYSLSHSSNLSGMTDVINKEGKKKVKKKIAGRK